METEREVIKNVKKKIFFPILICPQNHKICLLGRQNLHIYKVCEKRFLTKDRMSSLFNSIKGIVPEAKKRLYFIMLLCFII